MVQEILNPISWRLQPYREQVPKKDEDKSEHKDYMWLNSKDKLSPVEFYTYLKFRFGSPNGFSMLFKTDSSDNLIHWHYALISNGAVINIWGKTSGIKIFIKVFDGKTIGDDDWNLLAQNLKAEFKKHSKALKTQKDGLEHWSLFINPFARIELIVQEYLLELEKLNLDEPQSYVAGSKEEFNRYKKDLGRWTKNIAKAASLGTSIRMHCPVMAESFINLVILVFRNNELKKDERIYDNFLRQPIDIRVKTLHMNCSCFPKQIDVEGSAFKNFHTMMNNRNDVLHGNIAPKRLLAEDVWFDQSTIPLFKTEEGIIIKMMRNYCTNVEREKALNDYQVVSDLIELVLMSMDDESMRTFVMIMGDRMPGINNKTNRLGVLFSQQALVEGFVACK